MDTRLRDDPKVHWPAPVIAKLIHHHLESLDIDTLVTFDRGGVSSHPNHSAVFYAVAYMFVEKLIPKSKYNSVDICLDIFNFFTHFSIVVMLPYKLHKNIT